MLAVGCAGHDAVVEKPADELLDDGMRHFKKGNYQEAIEAFEQLKDWYPFSKFAILAELRIAESHFHLGQYADAVFAYEEFEKLHPRNEAVPYVIFQIGMSYYLQIDTVDRDQTPAEKAVAAFERLSRQYPDDVYSRLSQGYLDNCIKSLAGHELYVAIYYYRTKHYQAALGRFKSLIKNYSDVGIHSEAISYIHNCEERLKIQSKTGPKKDDIYFMPN
jgi:outer membrane protein assembly factor BamD